jgi:LuxR family transcriptional regulator, maltose regulon positive regulatory protein
MYEVLLTKLSPPHTEPGLLERPRLMELLAPEIKPLTLVTAPAGFGKTVLLHQLSLRLEKPLVWYQLDAYDNDPAVFIQYLVTGLQQHWPEVGRRALHMALQEINIEQRCRLLCTSIINDLVRIEAECILVLDDFHYLNQPGVSLLVKELLSNLPSRINTVIASRTALPFFPSGLPPARVQQIGPTELRFSRAEISSYLASRYGTVSGATVEEVETRTTGWPVALTLAGSLLTEGELRSKKKLSSEIPDLYHYLAEEILERQPDELRQFALHTAVLETLTPSSCDRLLERTDSAQVLETLAEKQLLLVPLAGEAKAYRYHQLLRSFLLDRLSLNERVALLRKAGRHAAAYGETERAVEYFLQAGLDEETEAVLQEEGLRALASGRWKTVDRWLGYLSQKQVEENPWFALFRAKIDIYQGCYDRAEQWVDRAVRCFKPSGERTGLAEGLILQARLRRCRGMYREGLELLEQACAYLSPQELSCRYDVSLERGIGLAQIGRLPESVQFLSEAEAAARQAGDTAAVAHLAEALGHLLYEQGRHTESLKAYQRSMLASPEQTLPGYYTQDLIAYIYRDWGQLDKALEWARQSVAVKETFELVETLPMAYGAVAYVYFEMGDFKAAEEYLRKALDLQYQYGADRYMVLVNEIALAWSICQLGRWVETQTLVEKTLVVAAEQEDLVAPLIRMIAGTILAQMGDLPRARELLHSAVEGLEKMDFRVRLCEAYKALAYVCSAQDDDQQFVEYAQKFLQLGSRMDYVGNGLQATATLLEPIFRFALVSGVEVTYVQRMMVRLGERTLTILEELSRHPEPSVRFRVVAPLAGLNSAKAREILTKLSEDRSTEIKRSVASLRLVSGSPHGPGGWSAAAPEAEIRFSTFGSFKILLQGKEIAGWRTRKARDLLAYLVHAADPVSKERIEDDLWPDQELSFRDTGLFRTNLYYLRRKLEQEGLPGYIVTRNGKYCLASKCFSLDSTEFEKLIGAARQGRPLREADVAALEQAVRLYRGDYLEDLNDYLWVVPRQFQLRQLYLNTLLAMAEYYYTNKLYPRAEQYLLKAKSVDPLSENAHCLLLKVLAATRRRSALHAMHGQFKQLFLDEVGVLPSPGTENIYRRLCGAPD